MTYILSAAILGLATTFHILLSLIPTPRIHCYERIDTLSATNQSYTCLSVLSNGIISNLFNTTREDAAINKGYVIPGLWDGHGHILGYGEMLQSVRLYGAKDIDGPYYLSGGFYQGVTV